MNILEPLRWFESSTNPATRAVPAGAAPERSASLAAWVSSDDASMRERALIEATFRRIRAFHEGCRQSASPATLAATLSAVIELAHLTFSLVVPRSAGHRPFRVECRLCLGELSSLQRTLGSDEHRPQLELLHALDPLIMLMVQIGGAVPAGSCERPHRSALSRPTRPETTARPTRKAPGLGHLAGSRRVSIGIAPSP